MGPSDDPVPIELADSTNIQNITNNEETSMNIPAENEPLVL